MAKNRRVKGFCGFCGDPVITGGKSYSGKWYHNPCYVAHSYGMPQNIKPGAKPRRSAPPRREIMDRSEEGLNPIEAGGMGRFPGQRSGTSRRPDEEGMVGMNPEGIQPELEILAHSNNVSFGMNPTRKGSHQMYYVWQGPRATAANIVRFPSYQQGNQYYRDVIDGKIGISKNPAGRFRMRPIFIIAGLVGVAALAYWLYKRRSTVQKVVGGVAAKMAAAPRPLDGFGGTP